MAVQPKKQKSTTKSKTTTKKKPTTKKTTAKPRKRKSKKKRHTKRNSFIILALFMMFTFVGFGFYLGQNSDDISVLIERGEIEGDYTTKKLLEDLSNIKAAHKEEKKTVVVKEKAKPKRTPKKTVLKPKVSKIKKVKKIKNPQIQKTVLFPQSHKPKLVIIIDDVSKKSQLRDIKETGMKLTPSIFPPSELSMTSHHLAKGLKHYMIHLPMESSSKQFNTQYKTLLTSFTKKQVQERVHELRQLFPTARYINNHTGSVYTNSYDAMHTLYRALRKEGFAFIDSRTVGSSKVRKIAHAFGDAYVARDIFIDNIHTIPYIHGQLQKAVKMAKKKGYAIAIGHPHSITLQALASSNEILKDVELVYIDRIYKRRSR